MNRPLDILILEDLQSDALLLLRELQRGGFAINHLVVDNAADLKNALEKRVWDIILSDYSMPGFDAPAALKIVQEQGLDLPFIVISGTVGEDAAVAAMKAGARDFFPKGKLTRLMPAVERELREAAERRKRHEAEQSLKQYTERLELLHEIDRAILRADQPQTIAQTVLARLQSLIGFSRATVTTFDLDNLQFTVLAAIAPTSAYHPYEDPAIRELLQQNEIYLVDDLLNVAQPSSNDQALIMAGIRSHVHIPLISSGKLLGAFSFFAEAPHALSRQALAIAREVATQLAIAIENARLLQVEQRRNYELTALHQASLQLTGSLDVEKVLDTILDYAILLVHANDAHIFLYDGEALAFGAAQWDGKKRDRSFVDPRLAELTYLVAQSGERLVIPNVHQHPTDKALPWRGAIIGLPLYIADKVNGVMSLAFTEPHHFDEHEIRLLELLADHAALAIHNAQLYQQIWHHAEDLEQRVQARTADLQVSEAKYRALIEFAPDPIVIVDATGYITLANKRAEEAFGYQQEELIGQSIEILLPESFRNIHVTHRTHYMAEPIKRTIGVNLNLIARHKDSTEIPVKIGLSPIDTGDEILIMAYIIDITLEKQLEEGLRSALAQERELNELKSRFVSMASHEFRTPLASILAFTETLLAYRQRLTDQQIEERLGKIQDRVGHLKAIMEDVLLLARLQARRAEFNPAKVDLDLLCRSVLDEFQSRSDVAHELIYSCDEALYEVTVDKKLMRQMISNLLSNAIKYSPSSKPVMIKLEYIDKMLVLQVRDEGIGIPEADLKHLFEPFHRAANVDTISGTGLGLTITKEAVELHGGAITVGSQVSVGTTFTVTIPVTIETKIDLKQIV